MPVKGTAMDQQFPFPFLMMNYRFVARRALRLVSNGVPARHRAKSFGSLFVVTAIDNVRYYGTLSQLPSAPRRGKVWDSVADAVNDLKSGDVILCGGSSTNEIMGRTRDGSCHDRFRFVWGTP
jgi:hypothetical protein